MISTGTLMLGKALLTAAALLGFGFWQLAVLRRLRREREQRQAHARSSQTHADTSSPTSAEATEAQSQPQADHSQR